MPRAPSPSPRPRRVARRCSGGWRRRAPRRAGRDPRWSVPAQDLTQWLTLPAARSRRHPDLPLYGAVTRLCDTSPMRAPKILAVASAVDLDFRYGCTPAWWQLWKGLYEEGVDLVVTPVPRTADRVAVVADGPEPDVRRRRVVRAGARRGRSAEGGPLPAARRREPRGRLGDRMTREVIWRWVTPRWRRTWRRSSSASGRTP